MKRLQFRAAEHRQSLPGIENERNAGRGELRRMLDHRLPAVRRHDPERDLPGVRDLVEVRILHRARMKCRDLIVIEIGGDEGLRGERIVDDLDVLEADPQRAQPLAIGPEIVPGGGHGQAAIAQQAQAVGDIRGAAAVLAAHLGHQERHVQDVNLVGEDVLP